MTWLKLNVAGGAGEAERGGAGGHQRHGDGEILAPIRTQPSKCQEAATEIKWDMTLQQCTILFTATASVPRSKILFSDGGVVRLLQRGNSSVHKINNFASLQHLLFSLGATASTGLWSQTNHFVLLHYGAIQTVLHMFVVFFPFPLPPQVSSRLPCIEQSTDLREVFTCLEFSLLDAKLALSQLKIY